MRLIKTLQVALLATALAFPAGAFGASSKDKPAPGHPPLEGALKQFTPIDPPRPVPDTPFEDGAGATLTLDRLRGKVILVNFWATWCAPCIEEMPSLDRLQADLGGADFSVVAISVDRGGARVAKPFLEKLGIARLGLYLDRNMTLARAMGVQGLPTSFLIDRDGRIVGRLTGTARWDGPEAKALIRRYLDRSHNIRSGGLQRVGTGVSPE